MYKEVEWRVVVSLGSCALVVLGIGYEDQSPNCIGSGMIMILKLEMFTPKRLIRVRGGVGG